MKTFFSLMAGLIGCACWAQPAPLPATRPQRDLRDVLGVTHVHGRYHFTEKDYLNEGADQVLELGTRVIKLYFHCWEKSYPYNSNWPKVNSLVELAQTPYYKSVFEKPLGTYILTVYSLGRPEHYWTGGVSPEQAADEQRQFYEFTRHLLKTYQGTGKTFVLQHWEGDWAVRGHTDPNKDPTPEAFAGMIAWLNARQAGVNQARAEAGEQGVRVLHAAEVNLVRQSMEKDRPGVANKVLPFAKVDLASYSAYDTQDNPKLFRAALEYIAKNMTDAGRPGVCRVYVGEYGVPEMTGGLERTRRVVPNVVDTALDFGCPYIVYWELYCNEPIREPVKRNEDCRGFWLIKPDGSKSWVWEYLWERLHAAKAK